MDNFQSAFRASNRAAVNNTFCDTLALAEKHPFEKVHSKFCKAVLGLKKTATNIGARSELDCQCSNRETTPAFTSVLTNAQSVSRNVAITFDRVVVNIKDGYDTTTGIFTSPNKGVYNFSSTVMNAQGQTLWVSLYLNDANMSSIWLSPSSQTHEMGTANMILDL
ncbi:collagen alpha-2(VIII) chain-like [Mytilus edulis]|uniref:collagen alpha-2(VIII) chain-like n=1 Tax=Mytilus edulis TaxID=6550 RepID=UPI0039EE9372